ncbi:hypothetical protein EGM51_09825 [Verrucomicrobia bacterium S94]|nr:hypothetical protein EGM51_09825 [Verrucomicrobia bacterium S94]
MKKSKLNREIQPMPEFVLDALTKEGLIEDYNSRPAYQRNDYLLWINSAKREDTKQNRLNQMLYELRVGGVYMKMEHPASKKK